MAIAPAGQGPAADFPMVLGEPFMLDGVLYTPADTLNYDEVGHAMSDPEGGQGITAAHRTLPLPSYVEVTSLESGRTILVRAERRGPMVGHRLVALSPGAMEQLGAAGEIPVRVRRVNPPEAERAMLRSGGMAPPRMDTPQSLVEVLKRRLPVTPLSGSDPAPTAAPAVAVAPAMAEPSTDAAFDEAMAAWEMPEAAHGDSGSGPAQVEPERHTIPASSGDPAGAVPVASGPGFVVQAGAFANKANAERVAQAIGGTIDQSGTLYRVRTGPFPDRAAAEASLAKVRGKGYSGARIYPVR